MISDYASIFELSVALNIAYAASEQVRKVVSDGFLYDARSLYNKYKTLTDNLGAKIGVMIDDDIDETPKEKIKKKIESYKSKLEKESNNLEKNLTESQELSANQIKPFYVLISIFSLFVLFLGGQESIHQIFPISELFSMLIFVSISIFVFIALLFSKYETPIVYTIFITILAILLSMIWSDIFIGVINYLDITQKYYVNTALIFAFIPFVLASTVLTVVSFFLSISYRIKFYKITKDYKDVEKHIENFRESKKFFDEE